ncbi:winged helix-turn-helix transcriptional regulator [Flavobacterium hibernum]|uniref:Transcriptional regulator n=1 Tax=Flavobacterium hibernum TaxID=37752 RepID=A0A0D0EYS4_9FLAO|nr:helix-turn-helix domain-containing protein [Flavobacterium hibernum]KIO50797.1 HxlR family transcriptional regulator [Flavobacterium hibernum]OXA90159.1 transcriptional regulator [Flavobacterium hibernum]PTS97628.1 transcriptional regulator [Flavobacterium sp. HMWF030]STO18656.1 HTH-type transcriptional activator hxlR [Flavobacterium hibernum]
MAKINDNGTLREANCSEELMAMRDSLDVLGGKWKLMILRFLTNRTHQIINFKKMQREIDGISAKMLSKELKELETNLLISRTEQQTRPITVVYAITEYGKSVLPVTETLVQWGLSHREKIIESIK